MEGGGTQRTRARLDQWLWFARFAKTRSLAARLCTAGAVTINRVAATKPNRPVRPGDVVTVPQGGWQHTVRIVALATRRGAASEARMLYEEVAAPTRLADLAPPWTPLLEPADE